MAAITESAEIFIAATPQEILAVMADAEAMPRWSPLHKSVEVLECDEHNRPVRAELTMSLFGLSDTHQLGYTWHADGVSWTLLKSSQQRSQDARYTLVPERDGTRVRFEITVRPAVPLPGFLLRRARKPFVDTATRGLRDRVLAEQTNR
ncbi:SRPBCC family protein [Mycolicibacterium septicum DSM 44393]|uniref:SRPBCC family protein n=1 Tax=Mycolicibacterium septicum DSM 44393 TaxID=1341646 RepID=A0A7X6MMG2_9MYCO|nr:SRPBCC family protein [Mycolicibacterium septicum]NKZ10843.1 SRPBCC family protein [Mycolicibacterium septicum DSM 44393]